MNVVNDSVSPLFTAFDADSCPDTTNEPAVALSHNETSLIVSVLVML